MGGQSDAGIEVDLTSPAWRAGLPTRTSSSCVARRVRHELDLISSFSNVCARDKFVSGGPPRCLPGLAAKNRVLTLRNVSVAVRHVAQVPRARGPA